MMKSMLLALALGAFAPTIALAQAAAPPHLQPMRAAILANDLERAIELGEAIVAKDPDDARAWQWLGRSYGQKAAQSGMLAAASLAKKCRKAYERAVTLDPGHAETQYELLEFYVRAPGFMGGGADKARAQAALVAKLDPVFGHLARALIAQVLDKDDAAAEREWRAAIAAGGPETRRARIALSNFLTAKQRWADARTLWSGVLAADAADATAPYMLGRTAALSGEQLEDGLALLDRYLALAVKPDDIGEAPAHWRRGLVLEKLGRKPEAIAAIERALALNPRLEAAKKDLARLHPT